MSVRPIVSIEGTYGTPLARNYASITGLQTFSPSAANKSGEGCVPLEVLIDLRCENSLFDRLVPQTDATFHYDKFNKLRLQNNVISVARTAQDSSAVHNHLRSQTVSPILVYRTRHLT